MTLWILDGVSYLDLGWIYKVVSAKTVYEIFNDSIDVLNSVFEILNLSDTAEQCYREDKCFRKSGRSTCCFGVIADLDGSDIELTRTSRIDVPDTSDYKKGRDSLWLM